MPRSQRRMVRECLVSMRWCYLRLSLIITFVSLTIDSLYDYRRLADFKCLVFFLRRAKPANTKVGSAQTSTFALWSSINACVLSSNFALFKWRNGICCFGSTRSTIFGRFQIVLQRGLRSIIRSGQVDGWLGGGKEGKGEGTFFHLQAMCQKRFSERLDYQR